MRITVGVLMIDGNNNEMLEVVSDNVRVEKISLFTDYIKGTPLIFSHT